MKHRDFDGEGFGDSDSRHLLVNVTPPSTFWHIPNFRIFINSEHFAPYSIIKEGEEMRLKNEACVECTHKCLQIHGNKKDSSPAVNSFFKVMIGQKFSKVLFLPPKFAKLLPDMVNEKAILEDSSGFQWDITISNVDGSTAFLQGWNVFSFAHNIKVGDFLVFDYVMKSHFVVKIYDNTGCEKKLDSSERSNQRKRRRDDKKTVIDGSSHTIDTSLSDKQGSSSSHISGLSGKKCEGLNEMNDVEKDPIATQNINERCEFVSKAENIDATYLMINRDLGTQQIEDRSPIIDLFSFEMWNNSGGGGINMVSGTDERFPQYVDSSSRSQNEVFMIDNKPMAKELDEEVFMSSKFSIAVPSDASNYEMIEMDNYSKEMDRKFISDNNPSIDKSSVNLLPISENPEENGESVPDMSNRDFTNCQLTEGLDSEPLSANDQDILSQKVGSSMNDGCQSAEKKCTRTSESFDAPTSFGTQNCLSDQIMEATKKELVENISYPCSQEKIDETYGESSKDKELHYQSFNMIIDLKDEDPEIKSETVESVGIPSGSTETDTGESSKDKELHYQSSNMIIDLKDEDPEITPETVDSVGIPSGSTETDTRESSKDKEPHHQNSNMIIDEKDEVDPEIKPETDEQISCLVASENQSFLELPTCLPHSCSLGKPRTVVFLRDPDMRLWPVMYHETSSFQVLTSGWKGFCLGNSIQPGDKFSLALVEDGPECMYEVRIIRK